MSINKSRFRTLSRCVLTSSLLLLPQYANALTTYGPGFVSRIYTSMSYDDVEILPGTELWGITSISAIRMDTTGHSVTIDPSTSTRIYSHIGNAVDIRAAGGSGLLRIGEGVQVNADSNAVMFYGPGRHAGLDNSGRLTSRGLRYLTIDYATVSVQSYQFGTITNRASGQIGNDYLSRVGIQISRNSAGDIENYGIISGRTTGLYVSSPLRGTVTNHLGGTIRSDTGDAIYMRYGITGGISNQGTITAGSSGYAINMQEGAVVNIQNAGTINGQVVLASSSNLTMLDGGIVNGNIRGSSAGHGAVTFDLSGDYASQGTMDGLDSINFNSGSVIMNHVIGGTTSNNNINLAGSNLTLNQNTTAGQFSHEWGCISLNATHHPHRSLPTNRWSTSGHSNR